MADKEALVRVTGRQCGVTLVELMVTLAVAAILTLGAIPAYRSMVHDNRVAADANEFAGFLALARSEAMKRPATVTITSTAGSGSNEWGGGAVATADVDVNGDGTVDANDVVARLSAFRGGLYIDSSSNVTTLTFTSRGYLEPLPGGAFILCETDSDLDGRSIVINAVGHLEISKTACSG